MENEFTMSQYASKDDLIAAMRERIEDLEDTVQFCERWAVHHGSKSCHKPQEILSAIQHYPGIKEVTQSYEDGKSPDTFNPYDRIASLEAQVKQLQDANSSLWAVAMNAAAYLEDASYCIKGDEEAKQSAIGAAQHVRTCCIKHCRAIEAAHNIK